MLGSALIAIPIARLTAAYGRRRGLTFGYAVAIIGALGMIAAGVVRNFPLLLIAATLFGGATASNSQTRYAAADLALPHRRARDLSIVVWATHLGLTSSAPPRRLRHSWVSHSSPAVSRSPSWGSCLQSQPC